MSGYIVNRVTGQQAATVPGWIPQLVILLTRYGPVCHLVHGQHVMTLVATLRWATVQLDAAAAWCPRCVFDTSGFMLSYGIWVACVFYRCSQLVAATRWGLRVLYA